MNIGIVGLGLIGGSLAKAYKRAGDTVFGEERDSLTLEFAKMAGAVDKELTKDKLKECDLILLAIPPKQAVKWMEENGPFLTEDALVIDCCGTKRVVCEAGFRLSEKYGFNYAGGHPMAGLQFGGFKYSRENLFDGALFALVPYDANNLKLMERIKSLILRAGFTSLAYTTAEEHDRIIAFTSQMAHVVSNAFVKSKTAKESGTAISAGSYRDFTRVAYLDADMWTELFLENRDNLKNEIDALCLELHKYSQALENESVEDLHLLLEEGKRSKMEVDKRWD